MSPTAVVEPGLRVAPGVVNTLTQPVVLGIRPLEGYPDVWEALIDDRRGGEPVVIRTMGPKVIRFIERCCVHTQARWAGVPFTLLPWQKGLLIELFEVRWDPDRGRFVRRYHEALVGTPKKNGKSDLLAAIGMYFLVADGEPSPVVVAAAANEVSAKLVFNPAKTMVQESHGARAPNVLSDVCDAWDTSIFVRGVVNAELRKVPASPKATEGLNLFVNLMDEWHEWTHPAAEQTATKLQNGAVLRPDYMNLRTTTAGHDEETLCGQDYLFGMAVADGEIEAPEWFFRWYEAPRKIERDGRLMDLDWRSREAIELANPSFGALAQWKFYEEKLRRSAEGIYRRYFLNQWTATEAAWLPTGAFEGCELPHLAPRPGGAAAIGWDASTKHDSTAVTLAQNVPVIDAETGQTVERKVLRTWIWERPFDIHTRRPVEGWVIPMDEVRAVILELMKVYDVRAGGLNYDPTFITWEAQALAASGHPVREFSQSSVQKLAQASQAFFEHVINGHIAHNGSAENGPHGNKVYTRQVNAAAARQTSSGSAAWLLTKGKAKKKMDAAMSTAMAIWGLEHPQEVAAPVKVNWA